MTPSKEEIKKWLKQTKKNRFWLAEQCSTGKRAVDKWFEKKGEVPAKAILTIQSLMEKSGWKRDHIVAEELPNQENLGKMFITLAPEIQNLVHQEAYRLGLTVTAYCSLAVEYAASNEEMRAEITSLHVSKKKSHSSNTQISPVIIGEGNAPSSNPLHQTTTTQRENC